MRTVQPQGPYLLGGWSMGSAVAFEMAWQLRARGEEAALLARRAAGERSRNGSEYRKVTSLGVA